MKNSLSKRYWLLALCAVPAVAYAQAVPVWLVFAVLSPLVFIFFTIVLGLVSRSWRIGLLHSGLVVGWVLLFALVSNIFVNDYVIWAPLVAMAAHALLVLALIVVHVVKRTKGRNIHEIS